MAASTAAEALARMQHAGAVDQQVEPIAFAVVAHQQQFALQFGDRARIGDVQRQDVQAPGIFAGQRVQGIGLARMARGGDDAVAARQQLADEFQADAAIGTGDEAMGAGHGDSLPVHVFRRRHAPGVCGCDAGLVA